MMDLEQGKRAPPPAYDDKDAAYHAPTDPNAPVRGILASPGKLSDNLRRSGVTGRHHGHTVEIHIEGPVQYREPGPPGPPEAVIPARRYRCSHCTYVSFVKMADVGSYIRCPFCFRTSTTDEEKTRGLGRLWLVAVFLSLGLMIGMFVLVGVNMSRATFDFNVGVGFVLPGMVALISLFSAGLLMAVASMYIWAPVSTYSEEPVMYQPSVDECPFLPRSM